jgi:hypothetical protein
VRLPEASISITHIYCKYTRLYIKSILLSRLVFCFTGQPGVRPSGLCNPLPFHRLCWRRLDKQRPQRDPELSYHWMLRAFRNPRYNFKSRRVSVSFRAVCHGCGSVFSNTLRLGCLLSSPSGHALGDDPRRLFQLMPARVPLTALLSGVPHFPTHTVLASEFQFARRLSRFLTFD